MWMQETLYMMYHIPISQLLLLLQYGWDQGRLIAKWFFSNNPGDQPPQFITSRRQVEPSDPSRPQPAAGGGRAANCTRLHHS